MCNQREKESVMTTIRPMTAEERQRSSEVETIQGKKF